MGGMGMGGGMMGGGMRSVPPTDLPNAVLNPGQTRGLNTRFVSLNAPNAEGIITYPEKGEPLQLGDVAQLGANPKVEAALRRLARDKAPESISQMVLWASAGMNWSDVTQLAKGWANPQEVALAKQLVSALDDKTDDTGRLLIEITAKNTAHQALASELKKLLSERSFLGLAVETKVPVRPTGPAVACKVQFAGTAEKPEASVQLAMTDATGLAWTKSINFALPVAKDDAGKPKAEAFGDALAEEVIKRLVAVKVTKSNSGGPIPKSPRDADLYTIRVENYSPLILNGVAVISAVAKPSEPAKVLLGVSISPRRNLSIPATGKSIEQIGLNKGVKVIALDLSGL